MIAERATRHYRGINYDTGTAYAHGADSRPEWTPDLMRRHLGTIGDELHANAVTVFGSHPSRLIDSARRRGPRAGCLGATTLARRLRDRDGRPGRRHRRGPRAAACGRCPGAAQRRLRADCLRGRPDPRHGLRAAGPAAALDVAAAASVQSAPRPAPGVGRRRGASTFRWGDHLRRRDLGVGVPPAATRRRIALASRRSSRTPTRSMCDMVAHGPMSNGEVPTSVGRTA